MDIKLKDDVRSFPQGSTPLDILGGLSQQLKKDAVAARVDGTVVSLMTPIDHDAEVEFLTFADDAGKHVLRHTASHVLAAAVKRLFPQAKLAIGPAIDTGFYYDFDVPEPFTPEDLGAIEKEMAKIIKQNPRMERFILPRDEAIAYETEQDEPYKVELISDLPEGEEISFYRMGDFTDLCAGPHLPAPSKIKAFKLLSIAGAYWRGDEHNKMLQRIYGTAFDTKEALDAYLAFLEEAKRRDHRRIGKEMDLFMFSEEGPGFPFMLPNGMILRNELENYWREMHREAGYQEIKTPIMLNQELWLQSGHWDHYRDNMYSTEIDGEAYAIKPMNCPGGMLAYKRRMYSYRDLPLRVGELGLVHRHELSGALHGLMRVRCFTQDDAHLFMTPEMITDEVIGVIDLATRLYDAFGFRYHVELSTRPEDSMGSEEDWERATNALRGALEVKGLPFVINEGDGAFYGPKIDFHLEDSIGRTWQCGTIQLDFQMPERFDLTYVGPDGEKHRPAMVHRVIFGSIERFMGILIEHFAGAFPVWLAPAQVKVMTITSRADEWAGEVTAALQALGVRAEADLRNEKIGFKIREAQQVGKVPYMLVLGDQEVENRMVAVRSRKEGDLGALSLEDFTARIITEIATKQMD